MECSEAKRLFPEEGAQSFYGILTPVLGVCRLEKGNRGGTGEE